MSGYIPLASPDHPLSYEWERADVFIDPSYTGTGVTVVCFKDNAPAHIIFHLYQAPATHTKSTKKRSYWDFYVSAAWVASEISEMIWMLDVATLDNITIYIEQPPPNSYTSPCLTGLSFAILYTMHKTCPIHLIPPTWINQKIKKENNKQDSITIRKTIAKERLEALNMLGVSFTNRFLLTDVAGDDVATSFLFYTLSGDYQSAFPRMESGYKGLSDGEKTE